MKMRCFEKPVLDNGHIREVGMKHFIYSSWNTHTHSVQSKIFDISHPALDRARRFRHRRNVLLLTRKSRAIHIIF